MKHADIVSRLSLEEKAKICTGKDYWHLYALPQFDLPEIMVSDGPHGLRMQDPNGKQVGLGNSLPATCFPTAATTACSWDVEMLEEMGEALGDECRAEKLSVLLGPGVNMKRSPLCGRNFEYFSEDPLLAGELGAAFVNGVQSKDIGTSLKHFAVNSQEARRMVIDEVVDERALREIYLAAFETVVKKAQPWTIMNAYNRLNGVYCSENEWLQQKVLRGEWGFKGLLVTDWGASVDRVKGIKNGTDIEMPSSVDINVPKIVNAVKNGTLDEKDLDERIDNIIELIMKSKKALAGNYTYDKNEHNALARKIAANCAVLMKNDDKILPISKEKKVAVIGEMAKSPRYQGAGSSLIKPTMLDNAYDELEKMGYSLTYSQGYNKKSDKPDNALISQAVQAAENADVVLIFAGLTEAYESEGYDRTHLLMPESHNNLIEAVAKVNKNVVVVLSGGSAVLMPWLDSVKGVLNGYLGGQASGGAIADVISGKVNPSGHLAETFAHHLGDTPTAGNYPGGKRLAEHKESIYIGYRYYDTAEKEVLFPFGFGLSYTQFEYSDLKLSAFSIKDTDTLEVTFKVKNVGDVDGADVAQVYVSDCESTIYRPKKELKAFKKVFLKAGEEKEVTVTLDKRSFAYYNVNINDWHVESGDFDILVCTDANTVVLSEKVNVESTVEAVVPDYRESAPAYYSADVHNIDDAQFEAVLGHAIPPRERDKSKPLTIYDCLDDAEDTKWGGRVIGLFKGAMNIALKSGVAGEDSNSGMMEAMMTQVPIRNFITMSMGLFSEDMANGLIDIISDKAPASGLGRILKGIPHAVMNIKTLLKSI